ncbi:hypothetical protein B0H14DRAFT_74110 [Mycena olivaceomarginata]|nr:hypothetical protein B0H14DRAFT_74110 [Mycena olivaceomarginata]
METTLQELRAHITASGFQSPAPNHASISAYIEKHIIKNSKSLFKERAPPLDIVLYAIRLLLGASTDAPRLGDIPDLLDFATTIEFYRKLALQKVDEALTFQRYYQANNDGHTTLTDEEIERLHQYTRDGPEVRTVYIEMILQYCQWDIYHLWTSDPPCPTDVTLRLCEYFPQSQWHLPKQRSDFPAAVPLRPDQRRARGPAFAWDRLLHVCERLVRLGQRTPN